MQEISHTDYVRLDMEIYRDYIEGCLTFKNPTHHNNGNYTLEAKNDLGVVNATVYGHFLDKPFNGKLVRGDNACSGNKFFDLTLQDVQEETI